MPDRPIDPADRIDVLSEVLDAVHLTTEFVGLLELGMPYELRIPEQDYLSFYVVARGSALLTLRAGGGETVLPLAVGDAVVLPHGSAHVLYDADRREARAQDLDYARCPRTGAHHTPRIGGAGPVTSLITAHFTFGDSRRNALLASLPPAIHLPAVAAASPPLGGIVAVLVGESMAAGPGSAIALAHLADLLLIHALRHWMTTTSDESGGLRAIADPAVGAALRLMHARPAEPWTVEQLAGAVAMSRSAFAARFTSLVGDPPLQYLARWRMSLAARLLSEKQLSVAAVAERVGYANPVTFTKAFARVQGVGPGAFRRRQRLRMPAGAMGGET